MRDLSNYWQAVQSTVCSKCIDSDGHGNCRLSGKDACGLHHSLPQIVESVLAVQSNTIGPYLESLRKNVCANCRSLSSDDTCTLRSSLDCGLDRYFPLVIDAIETVHSRTEATVEAFGD